MPNSKKKVTDEQLLLDSIDLLDEVIKNLKKIEKSEYVSESVVKYTKKGALGARDKLKVLKERLKFPDKELIDEEGEINGNRLELYDDNEQYPRKNVK